VESSFESERFFIPFIFIPDKDNDVGTYSEIFFHSLMVQIAVGNH